MTLILPGNDVIRNPNQRGRFVAILSKDLFRFVNDLKSLLFATFKSKQFHVSSFVHFFVLTSSLAKLFRGRSNIKNIISNCLYEDEIIIFNHLGRENSYSHHRLTLECQADLLSIDFHIFNILLTGSSQNGSCRSAYLKQINRLRDYHVNTQENIEKYCMVYFQKCCSLMHMNPFKIR